MSEEKLMPPSLTSEKRRRVEGVKAVAWAAIAAAGEAERKVAALEARLTTELQEVRAALSGAAAERLAAEAELRAEVAWARAELERLHGHVYAARVLVVEPRGARARRTTPRRRWWPWNQ